MLRNSSKSSKEQSSSPVPLGQLRDSPLTDRWTLLHEKGESGQSIGLFPILSLARRFGSISPATGSSRPFAGNDDSMKSQTCKIPANNTMKNEIELPTETPHCITSDRHSCMGATSFAELSLLKYPLRPVNSAPLYDFRCHG